MHVHSGPHAVSRGRAPLGAPAGPPLDARGLEETPAVVVEPARGRPRVLPAGRAAYRLSALLVLAALAASAASVYVPGLLQGPAVSRGTMRGTALVVLYLAVPVIAAAMVRTARGSARAVLVWFGAVAYVLYQSVLFLVATPFNRLYLVYVAMFGLALWSSAALVVQTDAQALRERFDRRLPRKGIAVYCWAIAALTAVSWLRSVVPASLSERPGDYLAGSGRTTNPVVIQDLALWLPLLTVAAVWLWRDEPLGHLLVGTVLTMLVMEAVGVAVDQWFGSLADPTTPLASVSMVGPMLVLAAVGSVPLVFLYRNLDRGPARRRSRWTPA